MGEKYLILPVSSEDDKDLEVEGVLALSKNEGIEIIDLRTIDEYEKSAPDWELSSPEELRASGYEDAPEGTALRRVFFPDTEEGRAELRRVSAELEALGAKIGEIESVDSEGWGTEWQKYYHPVEIGNDLLIVPSFEEVPETDRVVVRIEPGMAFGTGTHETTELCLLAIESMDVRGMRAIDIGCGSGILSFYLLKKGAASCEAYDIDEDALDNCRANARLNGVSPVIGTSDLLEKASGKYDLILANLLAPVLLRMLPDVDGYLAEGGRLVLSGILSEKASQISDALESLGYSVIERRDLGEWAMLCAARKEAR